jgi:hypothetical protein
MRYVNKQHNRRSIATVACRPSTSSKGKEVAQSADLGHAQTSDTTEVSRSTKRLARGNANRSSRSGEDNFRNN